MSIDLSGVVNALLGLVVTVIIALTPKIVALLNAKITAAHSDTRVNDVNLVSNGAARIAGEIAEQLVDVVKNDTNAQAQLSKLKDAAIEEGVKVLMNVRFPEVITKMGVTPETVGGMIRGELGKLIVGSVVPTPTGTTKGQNNGKDPA